MIHYCADISGLNAVLSEMVKPYSTVFILVDEHTEMYCLPLVGHDGSHLIRIQSGEQHKTIHTCEQIWHTLTDHNADRKSLLINLGGGVITDMGGFAASCYKRGVDFVNVPTTLLAMVDASLGGKTGIDFMGFKNQIGVFSEAKHVLICDEFLKTLDARQIKSGYAEIIKHYLIADGRAFDALGKGKLQPDIALIKKAVEIKSDIVAQDPLERGVRKKLNFGHTIGHALESYSLGTGAPLLHGEAVAYGIAIETYISLRKSLIDKDNAELIWDILASNFVIKYLAPDMVDGILKYALQDKKSEYGKIKMALIDDIGSCRIDVEVSVGEIEDAIKEFNERQRV